MPVLARAKLSYALVGYLLTFSELVSLVDSDDGWRGTGSGARISTSLRGGDNGWKMPAGAIWLKRAGGPPGDYETAIKTSRIDVRCYGAHDGEAMTVWEMLDAILVPATGERFASFERDGCKVADIRPEADAFADREPDTKYPYVWAPYICTWMGVASS